MQNVLKRLTSVDVMVLNYLSDKVYPQIGESRAQILAFSGIGISSFQLSQALMKLEVLGFVNSLKVGKTHNYYIASAGTKILNLLK